ncbi:nape-hydrolyzing phospholipase d [Apiospora sp. TS-2023a]
MRFLFRRLPRRGFQAPKDPRNTTQRASLTFAAAALPMAAYSTTVTKPSSLSPAPEDVDAKSHHVKNRRGETTKFTNPHASCDEPSPFQMLKWTLEHRWSGGRILADTKGMQLNVVKPELMSSRTGSDKLRATWLGHACYYVEFPSGLRVLFDPVFEDCCAPSQWLPPKRFTPPPCDVAALPHIDAVVVSHSHYDHLSYPTVKSIQKSHPDAHFFVGLGLAKWFHQSGIQNVTEMDWWQDVELTLTPQSSQPYSDEGGKSVAASSSPPRPITARFSCLPCQHRSGRGILDQMSTLWCSWAVSSPGPTPETTKSVWFGGDTGYRSVPKVPKGADDYGPEYAHLPVSPQFRQIGALRGPFDLGLIPIGAYAPRHIFSHMHCNPYDAVEIFRDTQCKRAMAIHHGTWALTAEDVREPPKMLKEALKRRGVAEEGVFDTCDPGETREF